MGLTAGQIPKLANVLNSGVALLSGNTAGALGSNLSGTTIYSAGTQGGRVISLMGNTDDTVTINVFLYILRSATVVPIGMVNIPLSSGNAFASRFPVDFLNGSNLPGLPIDNTGRQYIPLLANDLLRASTLANLTASPQRSLFISAHGLDYQT